MIGRHVRISKIFRGGRKFLSSPSISRFSSRRESCGCPPSISPGGRFGNPCAGSAATRLAPTARTSKSTSADDGGTAASREGGNQSPGRGVRGAGRHRNRVVRAKLLVRGGGGRRWRQHSCGSRLPPGDKKLRPPPFHPDSGCTTTTGRGLDDVDGSFYAR